jgi:hypothetical protein
MFDPQSGKKLVYQMIENAGSMNVSFTFDGRYFIDSEMPYQHDMVTEPFSCYAHVEFGET